MKAGAPLFNHGIRGEWHEGNECSCQSLLTVHRLFFKAPACLSALWRRGGRLVSRHAHGSVEYKDDFAHSPTFFYRIGVFPFLRPCPEELRQTLTYSPDWASGNNYHTARIFPVESHNEINWEMTVFLRI